VWDRIRESDLDAPRVCRPKGCAHCGQSGYRGRAAIYECLNVSEALARAIARQAPADELQALARAEGMADLAEDGWRKVLRGVTSIEEVLRVARVEDEAATRAGALGEAAGGPAAGGPREGAPGETALSGAGR